MSAPDPPVNVRYVLADGSEIPVDCRYLGADDEGIHRWEIIQPAPQSFTGIRADVFPARTGLSIPFELTGGAP